MPQYRNVTATVNRPNDTPWVGAVIEYTLRPGTQVDGVQFPTLTVRSSPADENGLTTARLAVIGDADFAAQYHWRNVRGESGAFSLEAGDLSDIDLSVLRVLFATESDANYASLFAATQLNFDKPEGATGSNVSLGIGAGGALEDAAIGSAGDGSFNVFIGVNAGAATTTGASDTFIGMNAGLSNTTGDNNTWIGQGAGRMATTAGDNTGVGKDAGRNITTGHSNTLMGLAAGKDISTGTHNAFFGFEAGKGASGEGAFPNTPMTGIENTGIGYYAGRGLTTGGNNTFLGSNAGRYATTALRNVFIGSSAAFEHLSGQDNVVIGVAAGRLGTTYNSCVFAGREAGYNNTADGGTFIGVNAGHENRAAAHNTLIGGYAGYDVTTGGTNTFVGFDAGRGVTTGAGNTIIGANVEGLAPGLINNIILAIGDGSIKARYDGSLATPAWNFVGNVGIGNEAPAQRFVVGDGSAALFAQIWTPAANIFIGQSGSTRFGYATGTIGLMLQSNGAFPLGIGTVGGADVVIGTNNTARMTFGSAGTITAHTSMTVSSAFGVNGAAAQPKAPLGVAEATDLASAISITNKLRTMAINNGMGQAS